jgi:hypothetical protein
MTDDCATGDCHTQTLVLNPSGDGGCSPDPDPWCPGDVNGTRDVEIDNQSGYPQKLWNIASGLLNPAPGGEINIAKDGKWNGTVGHTEGTYTYDDGESSAGPRNGTIDPS